MNSKPKFKRAYPNLFSPIEIRGQVIKNRLKSSPHSGGPNLYIAGDDGFSNFTETAAQYFGAIAKGGAGIVSTGHLGVDPRYYLGANCEHFNFHSDKTVHEHVLPVMHQMTDLIHAYGAKASIELNHGGTRTTPVEGNRVLGPCTRTLRNGKEVVAMDEEEMNKVADYFANAALIGKRGGFDIVNIHAAHGWLLSDFFSPITNKRTDKYGGSVENRARFPMMVFKRVREAIGEDMIMEFRFSVNEVSEGGITLEDAITTINMLSEYADIVQCSAGKVTKPITLGFMMPLQYMDPGLNCYLAEQVMDKVNIPVEVIGGVNDPEMADKLIREGKTHFVGMARSFIADPNWGEKARRGKEEDIVPCIRCLRCLNYAEAQTGTSMCTVNPRRIFPHPLKDSMNNIEVKKVAVIGGGPAGMQAAFEISRKGHEVVLFEKDNKLGGRLSFADHMVFKEDIKRYRDYLIKQVEKSENITIKLGVDATPELVANENPSSVVVAIGAKEIMPPIKGVELNNVMLSTDLYGNESKLGDKVIIIGGGSVGCETAIHLGTLNKSSVVLEMGEKLIPNGMETPEETLTTIFYLEHELNMGAKSLPEIKKSDLITTHTNTKCVEITEKGVWIENKDGELEFLESDNVILATGYKIDGEAVNAFDNLATDFIPVGDCKEVANILNTSSTGYYASLQV